MTSFVRNITIKVFSFAVIALMGLLITNNGVFTHSHKLEDGSVVIHAHPYDKSKDSQPYKSHHHTKAAFVFLKNLNLLFFSLFLVITSIFIIKIKQLYVDREKIYFRLFSRSNFSRAPPVS